MIQINKKTAAMPASEQVVLTLTADLRSKDRTRIQEAVEKLGDLELPVGIIQTLIDLVGEKTLDLETKVQVASVLSKIVGSEGVESNPGIDAILASPNGVATLLELVASRSTAPEIVNYAVQMVAVLIYSDAGAEAIFQQKQNVIQGVVKKLAELIVDTSTKSEVKLAAVKACGLFSCEKVVLHAIAALENLPTLVGALVNGKLQPAVSVMIARLATHPDGVGVVRDNPKAMRLLADDVDSKYREIKQLAVAALKSMEETTE